MFGADSSVSSRMWASCPAMKLRPSGDIPMGVRVVGHHRGVGGV